MFDIVIVPFHDCKKWLNEGFRTRDAHLYEQFQKDSNVGKILVVNRPVSLAETLIHRMSWKTKYGNVFAKGHKWELRKVSDKVFNIDFFDWDFFQVIKERKGWWFSAFNKRHVLDNLRNAISMLNLSNTVLFLENPMAVGVAQHLKFDFFAFDAIDNWLCHPQMSRYKTLVAQNYQYVDENADAVFTVSENLKKIFPTNGNVQWVSNGVDVEFFENGFKNEKSPLVVGYAGKIQERVDFDLIEICLKSFPNVKFQILGPVFSQKEKINFLKKKYSNIEFLGDVHYSKLPEQMKIWDVAIIPHKVNSFTASMNPLKLYEYLAAGKPVVSTEVAGVEKNVSPFVYTATSSEEFVSMLKKTLAGVGVSPKEISASIPYDYQWFNRANIISNKINSILE